MGVGTSGMAAAGPAGPGAAMVDSAVACLQTIGRPRPHYIPLMAHHDVAILCFDV